MTWKISLGLILALLIAGIAIHAPTAARTGQFLPETLPVQLDETDSTNIKIGELTYRGGIEVQASEAEVGGVSGLEWFEGRLFAVMDDGRWMVMTPDEIQGTLVDLLEIETGELKDERGKRLRRKTNADAEAIARSPNGNWLVAFEQDHRVWRYRDLDGPADERDDVASELLRDAASNSGLETLAVTNDGWLACGEWSGQTKPNCLRNSSGALTSFELTPPSPLVERGGVPTGAACASNDVCYVLFRSWSPALGNASAIVAIGPDGLSETLGVWDTSLTIDNFEGIAVREDANRTFLYIVSDNNFSNNQRTLLMKFEVSGRAAAAPGVPEKVFATVDVVIETSLGEFTVSLETERAPITAANFLRYVDEGRYADTRCYRAVQVEGGPVPSGFLQCGTQNNPARILDGIAHEPTNETGLSHTDGALSMARFAPGTATGDFSIMITDQRGLDADLEAENADRQAGFAVFGYVTSGMEVVHAIHQTPIDPDAGEGFLKGQMLAEPTQILNMRRAVTSD